MAAKTLRLAEELLDEINEFIENLWIGQADASKAEGQTEGQGASNANRTG